VISRVALPDPIAQCEAALEGLILDEQRAHPGLSHHTALRAVADAGPGLPCLALMNAFKAHRETLRGFVPPGREDREARQDVTEVLRGLSVDLVGEVLAVARGRKPPPRRLRPVDRDRVQGPVVDPTPLAAWRRYLDLRRLERGLAATATMRLASSAIQRAKALGQSTGDWEETLARAASRAARKAGAHPDAAARPI
jgi:hypothetical protein